MIKKGTRHLMLLLLFMSICFGAGALFLKPVKGLKTFKKKPFSKAVPGHIISFKIPQQIAAEIISEAGHFIAINVHANADITAVTPTITLDLPGSTVSPASGVTQDFSNGAILYVVDNSVSYSVNLYRAHTLAPICPGASVLIPGDSPTPPGTLLWQTLNTAGIWVTAAGATNSSPDYQTANLANTTSAPKVYSFRRSITVVGTTYDSYYDITVNPSTAISSNTINQPSAANSTFCVSGDPGTITGNPPAGGNGTYTYKWQSSVANGPFTDINGATGPDYAPGTINVSTVYQRVVSSGNCTPSKASNKVTITILNAITNNHLFQPGTTTFCGPSGSLSLQGQFPPSGGTGTFNYQWQSRIAGGTFTDIPGAAAQQHDYNSPSVTQTTDFQRLVKSGACSTWVPSDDIITITIQQRLSSNTIAATGPTAFCGSGTPTKITGSPVTGGDGTPVYQWESSPDGGTYQPIPGSNATKQDYDPPAITTTTYFHRTVKSGSCSTPTISNPVIFTVTPAITTNTIHIAASMFCASSGPITINGDPPAGGNGSFTYKWQSSTDNVNYSTIQGAIQGSYDSPSLTATTWFQRVVSSGACAGTSISAPVKITVYPALAGNTITAPPTAAFCQQGDAASITGSVPTGGDGSPSYQWQQSTDNVDAHFTNIPGETGKDLNPPLLTASMFYRRVVSDLTCTTPIISNVIEIHITPPIDASSNQIQPPLITTNCTSVDPSTIIGSLVSGGDGPGSIIYQWQISTDNGTTWTNILSNGNQPDYDPDPISKTTEYRRLASSGACTTLIPSVQVVTLTIVPSPPNITINNTAPICSGSTATLSIASPDPALTYNWYDTPAKDNLLFQGPVFTTPQPLTATQTFYAEASNGTCSSPQLASMQVTVNPLPGVPVLTETAPTGCNGSTLTLHVSSPQAGLTYNWYSAATGGVPVSTGPDFTTPVLSANVSYYVDATSGSGCTSSSRAGADITVYPLPVAVAQGADICPGTVAVLTCNTPDQDEIINWYSTATGGSIIFTGNSFTTPVLNTETTYYAEAVNTASGCVSATRSPARVQILTPLPPPVVHVSAAVAPEIIFTWAAVPGATAYRVSIDNGASYTEPSTGADGTSHTVAGLQIGQRVTIVVHALGGSLCETSTDSDPVTGVTTDPDIDKIFVANAFTPNGDGKNDVIYVHNDNIKSLKFFVYDQWGNMLFESLNQLKGWDGTYKGKIEPVGVYVYYLEAIMNDGQPVTKKGTITLLR